jgi:catechol-2,3-dioxygenase
MSIWGLAKTNPAPAADSAVDFPTKTRFHVALNVKDVAAITPFYAKLFGVTPHTVREGYSKFDLREPPLNFSLNEVPKNASGNGSFGIEVRSKEMLLGMLQRLNEASQLSGNALSSDADAVSVRDPEGNTWRIYVSKEAAPDRAYH